MTDVEDEPRVAEWAVFVEWPGIERRMDFAK